MPKIVDHDKKREEIALKAAGAFLEYGYKNIGMRLLCEQIGMSKSAVYHYFKSKDELFRAATEAIINFDANAIEHLPLATGASVETRIENFVLIFKHIAPRYFQEIKLVSDYIDVIGFDNIADDPCMRLSNQKYNAMLADYVSSEHSDELFTLILGLMSHQLLIGKELSNEYIISLAEKILRENI